jgi:trk system potassium uptake protein TrkH
MLIGGGSTSTAGGMKVVTFVVLLLATLAFFRRRKNVQAFGRSIGLEELLKVLAVTITMLIVVITALFVISITHDGDFMDLAFEVTSAMGTVGLSRGATGELDGIGRIVIMIVMFLGRVGPLTLGFFLATRVPPRTSFPPGKILIG